MRAEAAGQGAEGEGREVSVERTTCPGCGHNFIVKVAPPPASPLCLAEWSLDADRNTAYSLHQHKTVKLERGTMLLAVEFAGKPGRVLKRKDLMMMVCPHGANLRNVDAHLKRLRGQLGFDEKNGPIKTIHGMGYEYVP